MGDINDFSDEDWVVVIHDNDDVSSMNLSCLNFDSDLINVQGWSWESISTYADVLRRSASNFISRSALPLSCNIFKPFHNHSISSSCPQRANVRLEASAVNEHELYFKFKSSLRHHYTVVRHQRSERFYNELSHCRRKQYNRFPGCGRSCRMERRVENLTRRKDVRRQVWNDAARLLEEWEWEDDEFNYE